MSINYKLHLIKILYHFNIIGNINYILVVWK